MTSTIDDVSKGRFGVNIVSGWNKLEYSQMGLWRGDEYFKKRYEYAAEYLGLLRKLWKEERVTHQSEFFSFEDCKSYPETFPRNSDNMRRAVGQGNQLHWRTCRFRVSGRAGRQS